MISLRKVNAIFMMKTKMILNNYSILLGPLMAIGFVVLYKTIMPKGEGDAAEFMKTYILQLGVLFNILMSGIMGMSMPLAEEKEKNTLRVLMTSSVKGIEFFIGSLLPVLILLVIVNLVLLPVSCVTDINIPLYFVVTTAASCITMILGMIVGLVSNNQMATSFASTPLLLILMMIPLFAGMNEGMEKAAAYIYTGSLNEIIENLVSKSSTIVTVQHVAVMIVWLLISIIAFLFFYKRNGLDSE